MAPRLSTAYDEHGLPVDKSLELPVEELLKRARPLPPYPEMVIDDFTPKKTKPSSLPSSSDGQPRQSS